MKELLKFTPWKNTDTLVSLACGSGWWEINCVVHQSASRLILIDKDERILNQEEVEATISYFENAILTKNTTAILIKNEDVHHLSLENEVADYVFIFNAFHEFENIELVLKEARRILKKSGRLFLEEEISISEPLNHQGCGKKLFFLKELTHTISHFGFTLIDKKEKDQKAIYLLFEK